MINKSFQELKKYRCMVVGFSSEEGLRRNQRINFLSMNEEIKANYIMVINGIEFIMREIFSEYKVRFAKRNIEFEKDTIYIHLCHKDINGNIRISFNHRIPGYKNTHSIFFEKVSEDIYDVCLLNGLKD